MVMNMQSREITIRFAEQNYSNALPVTECKLEDNLILTFDKGRGNDSPKYYNDGAAIRLYAGNSIKINIGEEGILNFVEISSLKANPMGTGNCVINKGNLSISGTKAKISEINSDEIIIERNSSTGYVGISAITIGYTISDNYISSPKLPVSSNFMESMIVEITNLTDGATIFYTVDGSTPSVENGTIYTGPFTIIETTTIKAIAVKNGNTSSISEATYTRITPDCIFPEVNPKGGSTLENAVNILQYSTITITPAEYNIVTFSINATEPTIITDETDIIIEDIGPMILNVMSECNGAQLKKTYYYNVIEETPKVIATLDSYDIENAKYTSAGTGYGANNIVTSPYGEWTGYFAMTKSSENNGNNGFLQLNNTNGYHILSPEFPGKIISVSITFAQKTSSNSTRGFVIMPATYTKDNANSTTAGNLGYATYEGPGNPTSSVGLTSDVTSFKIYATDGAIYISKIEVVFEKPSDYILEVGSTGWATLYLGLDATIPDGVTCYAISSVTNDMAILSLIVNILPAFTGTIVKAMPNTDYTFRYCNNYVRSKDVNLLQGSVVDTRIPGEGYVLSVNNDIVGLYKAKQNNGTFLNNAHKAYLPASALPTIYQGNGLRFNTETSDIINTPQYNDAIAPIIYDLSGRRIEKMEKGIYIVNGRKIIK